MKAILTYTLVLVAATASAQEIIPRFGLTISKTNAEDVDLIKQKAVTGVTFGAGILFPLSGSLTLQPELNFVQKGFGIDFNETDQGVSVAVDNRTHINYLEVPVFLKHFFSAGSSKFFILAGPSIAFGIGGKSKSKVDTDLFGTDFSVTVTGKVKFGDPPPNYNPEEDREVYLDNRFDAGVHFGAGVIIKELYVIEARYNLGMTPLMDDDDDSKNRMFQISVGYRFLNPFSK